MADLNRYNISVGEIKPPKNKKFIATPTSKNKTKGITFDLKKKTIKEMMFDTESGISMKDEDFTDQVDISNKVYTDTPNTSMIDNKKKQEELFS